MSASEPVGRRFLLIVARGDSLANFPAHPLVTVWARNGLERKVEGGIDATKFGSIHVVDGVPNGLVTKIEGFADAKKPPLPVYHGSELATVTRLLAALGMPALPDEPAPSSIFDAAGQMRNQVRAAERGFGEAIQAWEAAETKLLSQTEELERVQRRVQELEAEVRQERSAKAEAVAQVDELRREIEKLRGEAAALRDDKQAAERELADLRVTFAGLTAQANAAKGEIERARQAAIEEGRRAWGEELSRLAREAQEGAKVPGLEKRLWEREARVRALEAMIVDQPQLLRAVKLPVAAKVVAVPKTVQPAPKAVAKPVVPSAKYPAEKPKKLAELADWMNREGLLTEANLIEYAAHYRLPLKGVKMAIRNSNRRLGKT